MASTGILAMEMRFLDTVHALRSLLHQGVRLGPHRHHGRQLAAAHRYSPHKREHGEVQ
jgi:hypothetical protein